MTEKSNLFVVQIGVTGGGQMFINRPTGYQKGDGDGPWEGGGGRPEPSAKVQETTALV
jgi:hypothetical protein